jgi:hypothetical protein
MTTSSVSLSAHRTGGHASYCRFGLEETKAWKCAAAHIIYACEPPLEKRRLHLLRGWSHLETKQGILGAAQVGKQESVGVPCEAGIILRCRTCRSMTIGNPNNRIDDEREDV